jgi:fructose-specific component phosphotransferase system IIB-like protein
MSTTILYHKNCNDGLIAALNFYAYFKENNQLNDVIFLPVQYGEKLPNESMLKGREVYVVR